MSEQPHITDGSPCWCNPKVVIVPSKVAFDTANKCCDWLQSDDDPITEGERQKCAELINAALAQHRQAVVDAMSLSNEMCEKLEQQLAAEREERKLLMEATRHAKLALAGVYPAPAALQECQDALAKEGK